MDNINSDFWDNRYSINEFVYGKEPNTFFSEEIKKLKPGRLYLPADGEGRNGIYAAKSGWHVDAVDFSANAREKAIQYALEEGVSINYIVSDLVSYNPPSLHYDAAAIVFLHLGKDSIKTVIEKTVASIKTGGTLIMQVYSKNQMGKTSGGPQNPDMLYSVDELAEYFKNLDIIKLAEEEIYLYESKFHYGDASVISAAGKKKE